MGLLCTRTTFLISLFSFFTGLVVSHDLFLEQNGTFLLVSSDEHLGADVAGEDDDDDSDHDVEFDGHAEEGGVGHAEGAP